MLDFQDNKFNEEDEKYMKNKERMLKSLKKIMRRNSDLRRLTCKAGKGKNELRRLEI